MAHESSDLEVFKIYEEGQTPTIWIAFFRIGELTLRRLAYGMLLFTIVMVTDIFMFGEKMRTKYLPHDFSWQGKTVLITIGLLICLGWFFAAGGFV